MIVPSARRSHCHNLEIYHRDLKSGNILVSKSQVLLANFDLATIGPESEDHYLLH